MQRTFGKHSKTSRAQHGPHSGSSGCLFYLKFISFSFRLFSVPACLAVAVAVAVSASPQLLSFMLCFVLFCFVLFYFVPLPLLLPLPASHLTWRGFYLSLGIYLILIKRNWLPDRNGGGAWHVGHGRKCGVLERRQKLRNFYLNMLIQAEPLSWPIRQSHCSCKDSHIERMFAQHVPSHSPSLPHPTLALLTHFISAATLAILRYLFSISKANSQLISIHHCLRLEHFSLIWISKSTFSEPEVSNVIKDRELSHTLRVLWDV